jgi:hypothetical protein
MKRRSKASGEPIKGRRRKTPVPKRRNAPKAAPRSNSPPSQEETEVARLNRELSEAHEQQAASSGVLAIISTSKGILEPVFQTILEKATCLCEAHFGILALQEKGIFRNVAMHNAPAALAEARRRDPVIPAGPQSALGRVAGTKQVVHIFDYAEDAAYNRRARAEGQGA